MKDYLNARGMRILAALDTVSARHSAKQAEVALAWVMAQPGVTAPIASATTLDQVDSLVRAASLKLGRGRYGRAGQGQRVAAARGSEHDRSRRSAVRLATLLSSIVARGRGSRWPKSSFAGRSPGSNCWRWCWRQRSSWAARVRRRSASPRSAPPSACAIRFATRRGSFLARSRCCWWWRPASWPCSPRCRGWRRCWRSASAAYILYLAFKIATAPPLAARDERGSAADLPRRLPARRRQSEGLCGDCRRACRLPTAAAILDVPARLAVLTLMIVAIHVLWLLAGAAFARYSAPAAGVADHQSDVRGDAGADHGTGGVALSSTRTEGD